MSGERRHRYVPEYPVRGTDLTALFVPDAVPLPAPYRPKLPEHVLLAAVLQRTLEDLTWEHRGWGWGRPGCHPDCVPCTARAWLSDLAAENDVQFTFSAVCTHLLLDPQASGVELRARLDRARGTRIRERAYGPPGVERRRPARGGVRAARDYQAREADGRSGNAGRAVAPSGVAAKAPALSPPLPRTPQNPDGNAGVASQRNPPADAGPASPDLGQVRGNYSGRGARGRGGDQGVELSPRPLGVPADHARGARREDRTGRERDPRLDGRAAGSGDDADDRGGLA